MPLALGICQVFRPKLSSSQLTKPDLRVKVPGGVWAELGNMAELGGAPASQTCNCRAGGGREAAGEKQEQGEVGTAWFPAAWPWREC